MTDRSSVGSEEQFTPFDPRADVYITKRQLPHWVQAGRTYFVTFRLADSIPQSRLIEWNEERAKWLSSHPQPWAPETASEFARLFTGRIQEWLDTGLGSCILKDPDISRTMEHTLLHFDGSRYLLGPFAVMPNHVHVLVMPLGSASLSEITKSWKSYAAKAINSILRRRGRVWQSESFDHIVRNSDYLRWYAAYIWDNPIRAGLASGTYRVGCGKLQFPK